MTFEEMMQAVDTFRSWPLDVQQYCVKIAGHRNVQTDESAKKSFTRRSQVFKPNKHNARWEDDESLQLLADVELIGSSGMDAFRSLSSKYARTPKALQDQWHKLKGAKS
jgi:hypothetical protein